jgi:FkbM family methyltransferase
MKLYNEKGKPVNSNAEIVEQNLVKAYVKPDDKVLELGARYGSVSIVTNKILNDKSSHYVVEPDSAVWECLENNMKLNNCNFNILKGVISKKKLNVYQNNYSTYTYEDNNSQVKCYEIPKIDFNVLIVDCEGFFETFYNENKSFFKDLKTIIFESDEPDRCNYDYLLDEFNNLGFKIIKCIEEPTCRNMYHYVLQK